MYFCYYLPLDKGVAFHLKNLNTLYPRMLCTVEIGQVILRRKSLQADRQTGNQKSPTELSAQVSQKKHKSTFGKRQLHVHQKTNQNYCSSFYPRTTVHAFENTDKKSPVTVPSERIKDPHFLFLPLFSSSGPFCKLEGFFPCMKSNSTNHNIYLIIAGVYSIKKS